MTKCFDAQWFGLRIMPVLLLSLYQNDSSALVFRFSDFVIVSSFDIRASSFISCGEKENAREHRVHD